MEKLTSVQQKVMDDIKANINLAKQFNDFKEYYIESKIGLNQGSMTELEEIKARRERQYELYCVEELEYRKQLWLDKLQNITTVWANSMTLRALERKGYIEIIHDGGSKVDTVKLLEK